MSARRLEMSVEQLKDKTTSQLAELGKKSDAINRMKVELGEKNATIFSLEAREKAVKEQLRATEEEFATKTELLRNAEQALAEKQAELAKLNTELNDRIVVAEARQVELVAVRTQIEELKSRVNERREGIFHDPGAADEGADRIRDRDTRARRGAQQGRRSEPARHRSRPPADRPDQGSRDARHAASTIWRGGCRRRASSWPNANSRTTSCSRTAEVAERTARNCAPRSRRTKAAACRASRNCAPRRPRWRNSCASRATNAPAAARHQRDPAAGGELLGHRADGKRAAARAHQRYRRRSRQACDAARRAEFADRGDARRRSRRR